MMKRSVFVAVMALFALTATAQDLNVGSFNIRNGRSLNEREQLKDRSELRGDYKKYDGWDDRKDPLCDMMNHEAFDVVGLQEVRHGQLRYMLEKMPDYAYVGVARDDGATKGEYCPVLYRKKDFTLLDSGTFWLSETPDEVSRGWDGACNRICTWAYLQRKSDKARFYFLSVHFDHRGKVAKMEGSKLVVEWVKKHCKGANVIVVGDFNYEPDKEFYKVFSESRVLQDAFDVATYRFFPTGSFSGFDPKRFTTRRGDHIFVNKGMKVSRYGVLTYHYYRELSEEDRDDYVPMAPGIEIRSIKVMSDHYPLQAFVTIK